MRFLVLGAGLQGFAAALDLARTPDVKEVVVADIDEERARRVAERLTEGPATVWAEQIDVANEPRLSARLAGYDVVISAVPYFLNAQLTRAAIEARVSFCDLGGNTDVVREQETCDAEARAAGVTIVPDCGLAPGMANVLAVAGMGRLDRTEEVHLRVGGLPVKPRPPLDYMMVFSMHGLLNEYLGTATVLRGGKLTPVETLTDVEELAFPKPVGRCEAFVTLGGTSTMPWTYQGRVKTLDYKTVRYPGHAAKIAMMRDLGLLEKQPVVVEGRSISPRAVFAAAAEPRLTFPGEPDLAVMRVQVIGWKEKKRREIVFEMLDRMDRRRGVTAMMRTTSYPTVAAALMIARGEVPFKGVAAMERAIPPEPFIRELKHHELKVAIRERTLPAARAPRARASAAGGVTRSRTAGASRGTRQGPPGLRERSGASRSPARRSRARRRGSASSSRG